VVPPQAARLASVTLVAVSKTDRDVRAEVQVNAQVVELAEDDRAWLAERRKEYEDLLAYLREH
jgi:predicted nucleic acid-binding Zn ribbon protein